MALESAEPAGRKRGVFLAMSLWMMKMTLRCHMRSKNELRVRLLTLTNCLHLVNLRRLCCGSSILDNRRITIVNISFVVLFAI